MSRKQARDHAFKLIFEIPFHGMTVQERLDLYYAQMEDRPSARDWDYIQTVVSTCFSNLDNIDKKLQGTLKNWTIERLPKVSAAILRLALCELECCDDIPYQVTINEAVELAKTYGDDDTPAFVNGVLANFVQQP